MNNMKVTLLLGLLTGILVVGGAAIGRESGMVIAFIIALALNFGSYWYSDKIVLAMYGAREATRDDAPALHRIVSEVAMAAQVPKPRVFITPHQAPNAFATGRNPEHGVVAVTEGMLHILSEYELKGVIAHEVGHIKNRDTLIQCMAAAIAGAITMLASMLRWAFIFGAGRSNDDDNNPLAMLAMVILAPIAALLVQLAISRTREYQADAAAARFTHNPLGLASALSKLESAAEHHPMHGNPSTAHLFIVNPFRGGVASLFSTHPPIRERIRRLQEMRGGA